MRVGIIRCQQTEDLCPGTKDLVCASHGMAAFKELGPCEVMGIVSCGGCPGKRAVARALMLKSKGAEAIALASCMKKGVPLNFPCPNYEQILKAIKEKLGPDFVVLESTH